MRPKVSALVPTILKYGFTSYSADRQDKHHVSTLASTCRYWARLSRRQLFQNITLRTKNDAICFGKILDTPTLRDLDPIPKVCAQLHAEPDNEDEPWLHHLFLSIVPKMQVPKLQKHQEFSLQVRFSVGKMQRTLHPSLPRAIPGSLTPVPQLHLEGVHFSSSRILSRLILSIPILRSLEAYKITFDAKPSYDDFFAPPFRRLMWEVRSDDLDLCLSLVPLLLANNSMLSSSRRTPTSTLNPDDLKTLWNLLLLFGDASSFHLSSFSRRDSSCALLYPL